MQATNRNWIVGAIVGFCLSAVNAFAGPPFGGSVAGCVPDDKLGVGCGRIVTASLDKLDAMVLKCHYIQAKRAYINGASSATEDANEESCTTTASDKFDLYMGKAGAYCAAGVVTDANARRATLLADASNPDSLDALNGSFYCDNSTGLTIADAGGGDQDEAGFIPATISNYKCEATVLKEAMKLFDRVYYCHYKLASYAQAGRTFDVDACEGAGTKGALGRYNKAVQRAIDAGTCPPCSVSGASALGSSLLASLDAQNEEIFPCP